MLLPVFGFAQQQTIIPQNDVTTPLHLMQPDYETPYNIPKSDEIIKVIDRVYNYLEANTPAQLITDSQTELSDFSQINFQTRFKQGDFRLISYEWGVTYAGMLLSTQATGDKKYTEYTFSRMKFLAEIYPFFLKLDQQNPETRHAMFSVIHPHALDDAGAMCAAMIKSKQAGLTSNLDPIITNFIDFISNRQFRLTDGTLARNRPMFNSLWLDDMFMSIPALAYMGKYTGENKYYDDAVKQILQFSQRMFNYEKGLFMHGWIMGMEEHPQFHWARANGWAVMTMVELLEVLPADYPGRDQVLDLLKRQIRGLANYQSPQGLWHQLIDKNDSYLETSATAIYTYSIARAINRGYVDAKVYGPMVCLAWNAVATRVNGKGQVEGTCVGTGMGFEPAFYYYRPVNVFAAHGYGPVLLAGAEMINLLKKSFPKMNDSAVMFYSKEIKTNAPIFEEE
jgi:rhamnogalacturonyl hydrolase YesR